LHFGICVSTDVHIFSGPETEDLKRELVKCELRNEELLTKLKAHERDILVEKREAEKVRCFLYLQIH
jgi:hypothetical protein